jgi:hypothetical protein
MAGIRIALERKADTEDVTEALDRLTRAIEQTGLIEAGAYPEDGDGESDLEEPREE